MARLEREINRDLGSLKELRKERTKLENKLFSYSGSYNDANDVQDLNLINEFITGIILRN